MIDKYQEALDDVIIAITLTPDYTPALRLRENIYKEMGKK
jgi:hypothetical protein